MLRWLPGAWLEHVPARDLAEADITTLAEAWEQDPGVVRTALIASGCYEAVKE